MDDIRIEPISPAAHPEPVQPPESVRPASAPASEPASEPPPANPITPVDDGLGTVIDVLA